MITIYTAEDFETLKKEYLSTSHYDVLWLPENECHSAKEAKKIRAFVEKYKESPHCEIYTLRETVSNIVGHMIAEGEIDNKNVSIIIVPHKTEYHYDSDGFILPDWPYGFYSW
jgi:hypothetical protein